MAKDAQNGGVVHNVTNGNGSMELEEPEVKSKPVAAIQQQTPPTSPTHKPGTINGGVAVPTPPRRTTGMLYQISSFCVK